MLQISSVGFYHFRSGLNIPGEITYVSRAASATLRHCSGLYASSFFQMRRTVAAMVRARVALAVDFR
jgi:hypothetical protein